MCSSGSQLPVLKCMVPVAGWLSSWALRSKRNFGSAQQQVAAKPCRLVIGTRDQFTSASTIKNWVASFNSSLAVSNMSPTSMADSAGVRPQVEGYQLQLQVVQEASHFWESQQARQELKHALTAFCEHLCAA